MSFYFFSLTTDMDRINLSPRVPAVQEFKSDNFRPGVRVHY